MRLIENRISMEFMLQVSIKVKNITIVKKDPFYVYKIWILFCRIEISTSGFIAGGQLPISYLPTIHFVFPQV